MADKAAKKRTRKRPPRRRKDDPNASTLSAWFGRNWIWIVVIGVLAVVIAGILIFIWTEKIRQQDRLAALTTAGTICSLAVGVGTAAAARGGIQTVTDRQTEQLIQHGNERWSTPPGAWNSQSAGGGGGGGGSPTHGAWEDARNFFSEVTGGGAQSSQPDERSANLEARKQWIQSKRQGA